MAWTSNLLALNELILYLRCSLAEEMQNFARQWVDPVFQFTWILFLTVSHVAMVVGLLVGLLSFSYVAGFSVTAAVFIIAYCLAFLIWYSGKRYVYTSIQFKSYDGFKIKFCDLK